MVEADHNSPVDETMHKGDDWPPDPRKALEDALGVNPDVDGLVGTCVQCGQRVTFDYHIEDDDWWKGAVPDATRRDVVCLPCLERIADGVPLHLIGVVYYTGFRGTLALVPVERIRQAFAQLEAEADKRREMHGLTLITLDRVIKERDSRYTHEEVWQTVEAVCDEYAARRWYGRSLRDCFDAILAQHEEKNDA